MAKAGKYASDKADAERFRWMLRCRWRYFDLDSFNADFPDFMANADINTMRKLIDVVIAAEADANARREKA